MCRARSSNIYNKKASRFLSYVDSSTFCTGRFQPIRNRSDTHQLVLLWWYLCVLFRLTTRYIRRPLSRTSCDNKEERKQLTSGFEFGWIPRIVSNQQANQRHFKPTQLCLSLVIEETLLPRVVGSRTANQIVEILRSHETDHLKAAIDRACLRPNEEDPQQPTTSSH